MGTFVVVVETPKVDTAYPLALAAWRGGVTIHLLIDKALLLEIMFLEEDSLLMSHRANTKLSFDCSYPRSLAQRRRSNSRSNRRRGKSGYRSERRRKSSERFITIDVYLQFAPAALSFILTE
jgi:hypothetical protein